MTSDVEQLRTVETNVPARLDRLPWSRFHWKVVAGLGTVWILDGLEVTIIGAIASRLIEKGSGVNMTAADVGLAGAIYVAGACIGALIFGQLTDRYGRKKLMMLTLTLYLLATVLTAFAFAPWYFFICRFFTGAGIGGEYSAINSAIDELIPANHRGQTDVTINGSYWVGSGIGSLGALLLLDQSIFATGFGWRLAFAIGAVLGLGILIIRNALPESPRWLFIHGHEDEAERIVGGIEDEVRRETNQDLETPGESITVRQRHTVPLTEIASVAFHEYPTRMVLGLALFVGQAFLYNAVVFDLGTLLGKYFNVSSGAVPAYFLAFAASNFLGAVLLARLFDTIGRRQMITGTYVISAVLVALLGFLWGGGALNEISFMAIIVAAFFFASAGASAAYLTVSEIFPMETRALAIAFFYALGTALGGIVGPVLFGYFIDSGNRALVIDGFYIGAVVMAVGALAELLFGVAAERQSLESIARPLSAIRHPAQAVRAAEESVRERIHRPGHAADAEDEGGATGA